MCVFGTKGMLLLLHESTEAKGIPRFGTEPTNIAEQQQQLFFSFFSLAENNKQAKKIRVSRAESLFCRCQKGWRHNDDDDDSHLDRYEIYLHLI